MTILCAVDGDDTPDQVVEASYDLAETYGDELVALHVMARERFEEIGDNRPEYYIDEGTAGAAETARNVVRETIDDSDRYTPKGRIGDPTEDLLQEAERIDARFIVIGGRRRTPVGKAIFGSTTQSVLLNARRPVVAIMDEAE